MDSLRSPLTPDVRCVDMLSRGLHSFVAHRRLPAFPCSPDRSLLNPVRGLQARPPSSLHTGFRPAEAAQAPYSHPRQHVRSTQRRVYQATSRRRACPRAFGPRQSASLVSCAASPLFPVPDRRPGHGAFRCLLPTVPSPQARCPASSIHPPHLTSACSGLASLRSARH